MTGYHKYVQCVRLAFRGLCQTGLITQSESKRFPFWQQTLQGRCSIGKVSPSFECGFSIVTV